MVKNNSVCAGLSQGNGGLTFGDYALQSLDPVSADPPAAPKSADSFPIPPRGVRIRAVHRCLHVEISRLERLAENSDYGVLRDLKQAQDDLQSFLRRHPEIVEGGAA